MLHIPSLIHSASPRALPTSETEIILPFQCMGGGRLRVLQNEELECAYTIPACILFSDNFVTCPYLAAREAVRTNRNTAAVPIS